MFSHASLAVTGGMTVVQGGGGEMAPRCLLCFSDCLHVYQIACQNCSVIIIQVRVCCHSEDAYKPGVLVHSFEKLTPHRAAAFCEIMLLLYLQIYLF